MNEIDIDNKKNDKLHYAIAAYFFFLFDRNS